MIDDDEIDDIGEMARGYFAFWEEKSLPDQAHIIPLGAQPHIDAVAEGFRPDGVYAVPLRYDLRGGEALWRMPIIERHCREMTNIVAGSSRGHFPCSICLSTAAGILLTEMFFTVTYPVHHEMYDAYMKPLIVSMQEYKRIFRKESE